MSTAGSFAKAVLTVAAVTAAILLLLVVLNSGGGATDDTFTLREASGGEQMSSSAGWRENATGEDLSRHAALKDSVREDEAEFDELQSELDGVQRGIERVDSLVLQREGPLSEAPASLLEERDELYTREGVIVAKQTALVVDNSAAYGEMEDIEAGYAEASSSGSGQSPFNLAFLFLGGCLLFIWLTRKQDGLKGVSDNLRRHFPSRSYKSQYPRFRYARNEPRYAELKREFEEAKEEVETAQGEVSKSDASDRLMCATAALRAYEEGFQDAQIQKREEAWIG